MHIIITTYAVITKELNSANLQCAVMRIPLTLAITSALGTALHVPEFKIIEFMTNYPRDIGYVRTEILRYWLDNDPHCSWESLAGALFVIGEKQVAEVIRGENNSKWTICLLTHSRLHM